MDQVGDWVVRGIVGALVAAFGALFLRVRTNEKELAVANKALERYERTEKDVGEMKTLTARIDERLKHLPTHDDLQRLHDRISKNGQSTAETKQELAALNESMRGLRSAVDRLHAVEIKRSGS